MSSKGEKGGSGGTRGPPGQGRRVQKLHLEAPPGGTLVPLGPRVWFPTTALVNIGRGMQGCSRWIQQYTDLQHPGTRTLANMWCQCTLWCQYILFNLTKCAQTYPWPYQKDARTANDEKLEGVECALFMNMSDRPPDPPAASQASLRLPGTAYLWLVSFILELASHILHWLWNQNVSLQVRLCINALWRPPLQVKSRVAATMQYRQNPFNPCLPRGYIAKTSSGKFSQIQSSDFKKSGSRMPIIVTYLDLKT